MIDPARQPRTTGMPFQFASIPRAWPGETVVVCGAGPSLCVADVDYAQWRTRVIAINDAYRLATAADAIYAADAQWWKWHAAIPDDALPPLKFTAQPDAQRERPSLSLIRTRAGTDLSTDPTVLVSGGHGGHQAINLAVLLSGGPILLLGYDMQPDPITGANHFHGEHPNRNKPNYRERLKAFVGLRRALDRLAIPIVNCSRQTAIPADVIPRGNLSDHLR